MFFVVGDRDRLIEQYPRNQVWAEIGVYRGDFSQKVVDICKPAEYYLIDNWTFEIKDHNPFPDEAENFGGFSSKIHWQHFGDDPVATQEHNYQHVTSRFAKNAEVKIVRANSIDGIKSLPDRHFDIMYVDANHQYEYVLRDMMEARTKLKPGGIMQMNDFYEGPGGADQNLGVMGAVNTFVKRYDFHYIAMSFGAYSDVILAEDPTSPLVMQFLENLNNSNLTFFGMSEALVPNIRYKAYRKKDGSERYLPMF
ncbi:MAG: class I SAM-dependent methyltransferase [Proteobacteria bacterium]|nr:class I SAM-dependent methyltransferase [Pseudomonadota bacterium]